jgi:acetylornithine/succinyldiaminopimelate/putrescine aminotransferase
MTNAEVIARNRAFESGVWAGRQPVAFVRGRGAELWDADGRRYLDFFAGLAVAGLGHCHPAVVEAIRRQAGELLHVSNIYHTAPAGELAELLCRHSFAERVFLCNSGAEANEAAMKLARRWGADRGGGRYEILATHGSFHGRTFGTLTATGQEKYQRGFQPLLPGIRLVPFGDLAAMTAAVGAETVAILVEPIQGECCCCSTRCRPAWAARDGSSRTSTTGSRPTS